MTKLTLRVELARKGNPEDGLSFGVKGSNSASCNVRIRMFDGSCLLPQHKCLRLAAWAVVLGAASIQHAPAVLHAGTLAGLVQSSFRAEVFAMLVAPSVAEMSCGPFVLWSDCEGVVSRVLRFQSGAPKPCPLSSNSDLWTQIWQLVQLVGERIQVRKVPAHDDPDRAQDAVHEWAVVQNVAADGAAKQANLNRPQSFWRMWNAVRVSYNKQVDVAQKVIALHAAIGTRAVRSKPDRAEMRRQPEQEAAAISLYMPRLRDTPMPKLVDRWGADYLDKLCKWLDGIFGNRDNGDPVIWISGVELLLDFLFEHQMVPPIYLPERKVWVRSPHIQAETAKRVRWFIGHCNAVAHVAGYQLQFRPRWPSCSALGVQLPCVPARIPGSRKEAIGMYVAEHVRLGKGRFHLRWRTMPLPSSLWRCGWF